MPDWNVLVFGSTADNLNETSDLGLVVERQTEQL